MLKAIVAYKNTIHSTTSLKPISLIINTASSEDNRELSERLHRKKADRIKDLNMKRNKRNNFDLRYKKIVSKDNKLKKS